MGYSPWGHKELDMIKQLSLSLSQGEKLGFNNFAVKYNCISSCLFFFPSDGVEELPSIYQVKSGLFKGVEEIWEKWGIRSSKPLCKYGWGAQKN